MKLLLTVRDSRPPVPHPPIRRLMAAMDCIPASCRFFLQILRDLVMGARADATIAGEVMAVAPRAMAQRHACAGCCW
jgi:hypothetical protein